MLEVRCRITVLVLMLACGCQSEHVFTITREKASPAPFVGFGAEFNPYLYCRPNWGEVNEQNVADLEQKILELAPQHVRIFMHLNWWSESGDTVIAKGDPRMRESFIRTVALAQQAGATVNVTLWYGPWTDPPAQMHRFVDILGELIRGHQLTAIQYVTIQNEPNGESDKGPYKISFATYNQLYRALDAELRNAGLRRQIAIIGGDLVARQQDIWIRNLGQNLADVCDGYSMHAYWDYWDTAKLLRRVSEVPRMIDALPPEQQRPLYAMEYGVRGLRKPREEPGRLADGQLITGTSVAAQEIAWFDLEAINRGYVALVQWDAYDAYYDIPMRYGLIGDVTTGWKLRPTYHLLRMFTHSAGPGWWAIHVDGTSEDESVAAMNGPDGTWSIFVQNRAKESEIVVLKGAPPSRIFHVTMWDPRAGGKLSAKSTVASDPHGNMRIKAPPMCVLALTTDELKL